MKSTKKGFTLVELLVVIAILAILATVSVVGYTAFIEKAHQSVAMQEMTQIRNALVAEDITNDGFDLSDGISGSSTIVVASTQGAQGTPSEAEIVLNFVQTLGIAGTYKVTGGGALQFSPAGKDATATCDFVTGEITTEKGAIKCDHANTETLPAQEPTCTETGLTEGLRCLDCGLVLTEQQVVEAKGHTEVVDSAVEATCTETGLTEGKHCSVCNAVLVAQTTTDALGHNEVEHEAQAPTCLEVGWEAYVTCSRCDYTTYVEIPATGHSWSDDSDTTCNNQGCNETRLVAPTLKDSQFTKDHDVYQKSTITIDLSENVDNVSDLQLTYSVGGEVLESSEYTYSIDGSYTHEPSYTDIEVTISYTLNEVEKTLTYTYKLGLKDSTANRLVNGGFEDGITGWTKVGNIGDVSSDTHYWLNDPESAEGFAFGMDGNKMFSAYAPGALESAVGTLTSSTFTVGGSGFVTFKVGAMRDENYVYIDVVDAETKQILARYYNGLWAERTNEVKSGCTLIAYKADLSAFMDKEVFFRISDNADSGYGLFFVDSFITYYENEPEGFNDATPVKYTVSGTIYDLFNGGFEMGNVQGWWNNGEIGVVTNASGYWGDNISYGKDGEYLFTGVQSFGADTMREGNKGVLTSSAFELGGTGYITFMLGGGENDLCYIQVIDATTNEVLARYHQQDMQDAVLKTYVADLSDYIGDTIRIQVVDYATDGWGCVSFDNVVTYYPVGMALPENAITATNIYNGVYTITNGSFETGNLDGWTPNGDKLGEVISEEIDAEWYLKNNERKEGDCLFSFAFKNGEEIVNLEGAKGTLESSTFTLKQGTFVSFRFGGAGGAEGQALVNTEVYIQLVRADGTVIATFYNNAEGKVNTQMNAYFYQYTGETADFFFRVVDNATSNYGCFVVDDFRVNLESAPEGFVENKQLP